MVIKYATGVNGIHVVTTQDLYAKMSFETLHHRSDPSSLYKVSAFILSSVATEGCSIQKEMN